jgi:hypothetical protein
MSDNIGKSRFTKPWWAEDQCMVQGFGTVSGGVNKQLHLVTHFGLTFIFQERFRPNCALNTHILWQRLSFDNAFTHG